MANKRHGEDRIPPGWVAPREPRDEGHAPNLNTEGSIGAWTAKASARSGPKFATGKSS